MAWKKPAFDLDALFEDATMRRGGETDAQFVERIRNESCDMFSSEEEDFCDWGDCPGMKICKDCETVPKNEVLKP